MKMALTEVYEVATFYAHFDVVKEGELPPPPITVRVCNSLSCAMAGAEKLMKDLSNKLGREVRVVHAPCMGGCDRAPVYLFPQLFDFTSGRFRPAQPVVDEPAAPTLVAQRRPGGSTPPGIGSLGVFRLAATTSQLADEGEAVNLVAPREADDSNLATAWREGASSDGRGEWLTAIAEASAYRLGAMAIVPGAAQDRRSFAAAHRLKRVLLVLSPTERYRIVFPQDPLLDSGGFATPYRVDLPKPVAARCATLIIEEVYRTRSGQRDGGEAQGQVTRRQHT